jgi:hypothetical protein
MPARVVGAGGAQNEGAWTASTYSSKTAQELGSGVITEFRPVTILKIGDGQRAEHPSSPKTKRTPENYG